MVHEIRLELDDLSYTRDFPPMRWQLYVDGDYFGTLRSEIVYGDHGRYREKLALLPVLMDLLQLEERPEPYSRFKLKDDNGYQVKLEALELIFIACSSSEGLAAVKHARVIEELMTFKEIIEWHRLLTTGKFKRFLQASFRNYLRTRKGELSK